MDLSELTGRRLSHLARLHFWLVLITGVLLFLVATVWSDAPQLLGQLHAFRALSEHISASSSAMRDFYYEETIPSQWRESMEQQVMEILRECVRMGVDLSSDSYEEVARKSGFWFTSFSDWHSAFPLPDSSALHALRESIVQPQWSAYAAHGATVLRKASWKIEGPWEEASVRYYASGGQQEDSAAGLGPIAVIISSEGFAEQRRGDEPDSLIDMSHALGMVYSPIGWKRLHDDWFADRYPILERHWDELKDSSLVGACMAVESSVAGTDTTNGLTLSVFGTVLQGRALGIVAPALIVVLLLTMYAYALQFRRVLFEYGVSLATRQSLQLSPWLGTHKSVWSIVLCVTSIVLLPSYTVAFVHREIHLLSSRVSILAGVIVGLLGVLVVYQGFRVAWFSARHR